MDGEAQAKGSRIRMNLLHIYAQPDCHTEAWVVGDREGLKALRDAIDAALADEDKSASTEVFAQDNEGYKILVVQTDRQTVDRKDIRLPYANAAYEGKHPLVLVGPSRYRELTIVPEESG